MPRMSAKVTVTFYTIKGTYPVVARTTSGSVPSNSTSQFNDGLLAFETQNDSSQDMPSFTIQLTDDYDWSTLLVPNDYVRIDVSYYSNIFSTEAKKVVNTTLACGLISNINRGIDSQSNSRIYTVTCQGVAKIIYNMNLSTFSELTSTLTSYVLLPDDAKKGIKFGNRSSGDIIEQVFNRFITGNNGFTDYAFNNDNLSVPMSNILKLSIIKNSDEAMQTMAYNRFSNYNGTILQMIGDIAAKPFNEIYWTHEDGVATFNYRPTPFDQERWEALERISLSPSDIISEQVSITDTDQYSIFKLLAYSGLGSETYSGGWSGHLAPLTNTQLIRRYGYKMLEVQVDYFNGDTKNQDDDSTGETNQNLSSWAKKYSSKAKSICSKLDASDMYPYLMTIIQLEHGSNSDPINAASHGGTNINGETASLTFGAKFLKRMNSKASDESHKVTDKLALVQAYNFGKGYIDYLSDENSSSMSLSLNMAYSAKIAKRKGNSSLAKIPYSTAVSKKYGKNYLYRNGANFYYGYEAKTYLGGSNDSSSFTIQNSTAPSTEGTTESEAKKHYPLYENLEDMLAYAAGNSTSSTATIATQYGGESEYQKVLSILKEKPSRSSFSSQVKSLSYSISKVKADAIYTNYKEGKGSVEKRVRRTAYLSIIAPTQRITNSKISSNYSYLKTLKKMKAHPKKAALQLIEVSSYSLGSKQAYEIIKKFVANKGSISAAEYNAILKKYAFNDTESGVNPLTGNGSINSVPYLFVKYTEKLFNWFADNSKFHSGTITINGTAGIEVGKRLLVKDDKDGVYWEYYIESVSHNWSFQSGWTTAIGVTRGLPLSSESDDRRFTYPKSFWGSYEEFKGGYFGEYDLATSESLYANSDSDDADSDGGSGSGTAEKALNYALDLEKKKGSSSVYDQGYHGSNPFNMGTVRGDCSQLVYFAFKKAGVDISSGGGWRTTEIAKSSKLKTVSKEGGNKSSAYKKLKKGDIVFFNTEGSDSHMAIYAGDDTCVGFQSAPNMLSTFKLKNNQYWYGCWRSHICRLK